MIHKISDLIIRTKGRMSAGWLSNYQHEDTSYIQQRAGYSEISLNLPNAIR